MCEEGSRADHKDLTPQAEPLPEGFSHMVGTGVQRQGETLTRILDAGTLFPESSYCVFPQYVDMLASPSDGVTDPNQEIEPGNLSSNIPDEYTAILDDRFVRSLFISAIRCVMLCYPKIYHAIIERRLGNVERYFFQNTSDRKKLLLSFNEPFANDLLMKVMRAAATTGRGLDHAILAMLLAMGLENKADSFACAGIDMAVERVPLLPDDARASLAALAVLDGVTTVVGDIDQGLNGLDKSFSIILGDDILPIGFKEHDWLNVLLSLGLIQSTNTHTNIGKKYMSKLDGYFCAGIKENSSDHLKAVQLLGNAAIPTQVSLVSHAMNPGYMRVPVPRWNDFLWLRVELTKAYGIFTGNNVIGLVTEQMEAFKAVHNLYEKTTEAISKDMEQRFMAKWDEHQSLIKIHRWWDSFQSGFIMTCIGEAVTHALGRVRDAKQFWFWTQLANQLPQDEKGAN